MIDIYNVSKQFGIKKILEDVSCNIHEKDRIAIIGQNGCGKSSLVKMIQSQLKPDSGKILLKNNMKMNFFKQEAQLTENETVLEYLRNSLSYLVEVKKKFEHTIELLENNFHDEELIKQNSKLSMILDFYNGWDLDNKLDKIIQKFSLEVFRHKNVQLLSGGEKRRVILAGLLLKENDVLILDEPTNHLDVYMVSFLEEVLLKSNFTLIFISHDRYFLDNIATRILEIDQGALREYKGGYADYLRQKELILKEKEKDNDTLLRLLKNEEEWLAKGVKARRKRNERRKENLMTLRETSKQTPSVIRKMKMELQREKANFQHPDNKKSKRKMLFEIDNLSLKIGKKILIENFTTRILQKDKIAIVGKNGSGKSTLIKALLNQFDFEGSIKKGDFSIGYFDQNKNDLDDSKTLIETFCPHGGDRVEVQGRSLHVYGYLKNWLFPREFLTNKIGSFSGGEKTRVALALLFSQQKDVLILDEPTNDLDIFTINILEDTLAKFNGALIFVSHDRYFVDKVAQRLFVIKDNMIEENTMRYSEFLEIEKDMGYLQSIQNKREKTTIIKDKKEKPIKQSLSYKEVLEHEKLFASIEALEQEIAEINKCLSDPACYNQYGISTLGEKVEKLNLDYDAKVERFLYLDSHI